MDVVQTKEARRVRGRGIAPALLVFGILVSAATRSGAVPVVFNLPWPAGETRIVNQGNGGDGSHSCSSTSDFKGQNCYAFDFSGTEGVDTVVAAADGEVVKTIDTPNNRAEFGNMVLLRHSDNSCTLYGHLFAGSVTKATSVKRGDRIGVVGDTGISFGAHLHFQRLSACTPSDYYWSVFAGGFSETNGQTPGSGARLKSNNSVSKVAARDATLVRNGGFNGGGGYWSPINGANFVVYQNGQAGTPSYEGTGFAATNTGNVGGGIFQDIATSFSIGDTICAEAMVRAQGNGNAGGVYALWLLGSGGQENSTVSYNVGSTWSPIKTCATAAMPGTQVRVQFYPAAYGGTLAIDAVDVL